MNLTTLKAFRHGMYDCFGNAKDALFNLVDALASEAGARSFLELSFSPFFERSWASVYEALEDGQIDAGRLREVLVTFAPLPEPGQAVGARMEGFKRIDIPEYSLEVLREAVINAVVHRDYSKRGESVRMFCYPDRVEIHSPGLLLPGITVEQMERGEVQSKLRNPVLAGLLKGIPGYMERLGSGIRFMLDETRCLKLPAPHFREMGEFVVAFNQAPDLARPRPQSQPQYSGTLWSEHEQLPVEEPVKNLPPEQESRLTDAVAYVREHGFITNKLYRELTGVSDRTAHRDLETLVERGRLKAVGQRAARRYVLA